MERRAFLAFNTGPFPQPFWYATGGAWMDVALSRSLDHVTAEIAIAAVHHDARVIWLHPVY